MTNVNVLPTSIEQLPTEIFLQIFGYFHLRELNRTFFGLNSHINSIVQSVRNASYVVQYNDPDAVQLLQVFSKQIACLIIVKTDMVDFASLSNLRSLTLKYISDAQLKSIRSQYFPLLEILHIYVWPSNLSPENAIEVDDLFQMIFNNEFPRLWLCTALGIVPLTASETWSSSPSLRFLYVPMKTAKDYKRLFNICPNLRWFPSPENVSVDPINQVPEIVNNKANQRIWNHLNELNQLELEGKFISEVNPFIVFKSKKCQSYAQQQNSLVVYGRIFPQAEPYCGASFLIEITIPSVYPFKKPEIVFLDPIHHPNIDENGKISFQGWLNIFGWWCPNDHLIDIIKIIININDQDLSITSSDNDKPPKDAAVQLLQYLDILYPNGVPINTVTNVERNTSPNYKDEVMMFFDIVGTYAQDCNYDLMPTYQMTCDAGKIAQANWTQIKQMLTCLSSAERLSYYNNANAIESGRIKWILLRLKELVKQ